MSRHFPFSFMPNHRDGYDVIDVTTSRNLGTVAPTYEPRPGSKHRRCDADWVATAPDGATERFVLRRHAAKWLLDYRGPAVPGLRLGRCVTWQEVEIHGWHRRWIVWFSPVLNGTFPPEAKSFCSGAEFTAEVPGSYVAQHLPLIRDCIPLDDDRQPCRLPDSGETP